MSKTSQAINMIRFAAGSCKPIAGPLKVQWEITYKCNLKCRHCHLWQTKDHNELTTEQARSLISDLKDLDIMSLSFSGGEPFLRQDIYELISYANSLGINTSINTNGTKLANIENAEQICESGLGTAFVSLDGPDPDMHNALRGSPHAFENALKAIDNLIKIRKNGKPKVFINTTVTGENINSLQGIVDLAREHGVDGMTMSILQDVGKFSPEEKVAIKPDDMHDLSTRLRKLASDSCGIIPHSNEYLDNFSTYINNPDELYKYRCAAGYATAMIHPNGDVYPCPVAFKKMGNLREKPFTDIWFSEEANDIRKKIKSNKHPICWFDCVAPISIIMHNIRTLKLSRVLHKNTLSHIIQKITG
ncbi:MAG: radical SAM protein [Armatimonadota bacterium]